MNLQNKSQLLKRQFLEEIADKLGFRKDRRIAFVERFDPRNWHMAHEELSTSIKWTKDLIAQSKCTEQKDNQPNSNPKTQNQKEGATRRHLYADRSQKLRDELRKIYPALKALEIEGFPQLILQRGGYETGQTPSEKTYDWLWNDKFPKWLSKRQIDWYDTCLKMLNNNNLRSLTSNYLLADREDAQFEFDKIFVPLALVQSTKQDERSAEVFPEAGTRLYETQGQRFEHDDFFTQILEGRKGKTNGERIALIGEPGAGKTTLLQRIAFWLMGETDSPRQQKIKNVAIWISLAKLQGRSLEEYLRQTWLEEALEVPRVTSEQEDALVELFKSGRVWLLLDGVDEMTSGDLQQVIPDGMRGWVASARVVVTCRLNIWQANPKFLAEFETYRLMDFDYPQQVRQFIGNWFKTSDTAKGERLKTQLDATEQVRLQDLVQNPLRLTLLCNIWQRWEGKLPQTKALLYQMFVEQFYEWKEDFFDISHQEKEELNSALERLAKLDIDGDVSRFRLLESFIRKELGNPKDENSLFYKAIRLGWLNNVGIAPESSTHETVYAFFHPTFEEYFAAKEIENWNFFLNHIPDNPNCSDASYRIFEPKWEEVILLWLGRDDVPSKDKGEFIQALMEFDGGCGNFYNLRAYFLAAKGIAEFKDCPRASEIVEQIVEWGFGSYNIPQVLMWEIFAVLRETERTKAINALELLIRNSQARHINIWRATECLEAIDNGNPIAIDTLLNLFQNSQSRDTCWVVGSTLARIGSGKSKVIKAMVEILQNFESKEICMEAGSCLQQIGSGDRIAIEALESLIQNSPPGDNRTRAALTLGRINPGNIKAIKFLVQLIQNFESEDIRSLGEWNLGNAIWDLGDIGSGNLTAINTLVKLIQQSPPEKILLGAVASLKRIGADNPAVIDALESLLSQTQSEKILKLVAESLRKSCSGRLTTIDTLVKLIQQPPSEEILLQAAISLLKIDPDKPEAIEALESIIQNSQDRTFLRRLAQIIWLEKIDLGSNLKVINTVINALVKLVQLAQDYSDIMLAGFRLKTIDSAKPKFITALEWQIRNSQDEEIRLQAAQSLREVDSDNPIIIDTLESLAQDSQDEEIRLQAAQSLLEINKHNSIALDTLRSSAQNCPSSDTSGDQVVRSLSILGTDRMKQVVTELKDRISNRPSTNDFREYRHWYEIIWNCAQTLTYPEFYQAWHPSPYTPYPEVLETSGVGFTPDSQSLNLTKLPRYLRAALNSNSDLRDAVQLICIDGSNFIERDNPAPYIYTQIVRYGCLERDGGIPETMNYLQAYWEMLPMRSDRRVFLVFYEDPITPPQGFSETFLEDLSKFDKTICVISNQPNIPPKLQSFSPNQVNLAANVMAWIGEKIGDDSF